jgi:pantoate--beta-alanine ligase
MLIFRTVAELQSWILFHKSLGKSIGFVPTMGALHIGHISLIHQSKRDTDVTVCSIFVNPTQFNDPKDLEKYPRTLDTDTRLLTDARCDILFYPSVPEIYPKDLAEINVDLQGLDVVMEGKHRPGHFKGVVQVVYRLLDIVKPDRLYMGQKDFQQFTIIKKMIEVLHLSVQLEVCPIAREPNGLAMSSRNVRLSKSAKSEASKIYEIISQAPKLMNTMSPEMISNCCFDAFNLDPFRIEYAEVVDTEKLLPVKVWGPIGSAVLCVAVWLDGVRLIDNIIL